MGNISNSKLFIFCDCIGHNKNDTWMTDGAWLTYPKPQGHECRICNLQYESIPLNTNRTFYEMRANLYIGVHARNSLNMCYFNRVVKLWPALPEMDLELSIFVCKEIKKFPLALVLYNFNPDFPCTWHYLCPCSTCFSLSSPLKLSHL